MRLPEGPPHLALNPPCLFFCFCFSLLFFAPFLSLFIIEKPCFPPLKKGHFLFAFSVSLSFSLAIFGLPLCHFLFLCLSLFLFFFPSFLSFFLLYFCFLFLFFFSFFFLLCFCFMKRTTSTYSITKFLFINPFSFLLVSSLLFFQIPFPYLCFFLILSFVFCSTSVFFFEKCKLKKHIFSKKKVCNITVFFYQPVFCKM